MRLLQLGLVRLGDLAAADQLDEPGHHRDKPVVILMHPGEQLNFVAGDELQPFQIVAELVELAQRAVERPLVRREEGAGNPVELARRIVLDLPVGGDLALRSDQRGGAVVDAAEHIEPDRAQRDQQCDDRQKRRQQLCLHAHRRARDEANQRIGESDQCYLTGSTERRATLIA